MSIFYLVAVLVIITFAVPIVLAVIMYKKGGSKTPSSNVKPDFSEDQRYHLSIYEFSGDVQGFEDIVAVQMKSYRDTGLILNSTDDPILSKQMSVNKAVRLELGLIINSAREIKRVDKDDILYLFKSMRVQNIKLPSVSGIYSCIFNAVAKDKTIVMKMAKIAAEEDL